MTPAQRSVSPPPAPIPGAYWLIDGQLLAGEYPGSRDVEDARRKLAAMLDAGIRSFLDLTETSDPLEPYEKILGDVARLRGVEARYRRMPIRDMSIPTVDAMKAVLRTIRTEVNAGRPVYFHCWGGIGRTGTVAACWLVEQGHDCDSALQMLKTLRATTHDALVESPQTPRQVQFVREWRPDVRGEEG
jgi:hypothetical protein